MKKEWQTCSGFPPCVNKYPAEYDDVEALYSDGSIGVSHMYINAIGHKAWFEKSFYIPKECPTHWRPISTTD